MNFSTQNLKHGALFLGGGLVFIVEFFLIKKNTTYFPFSKCLLSLADVYISFHLIVFNK